MTVYELIGNTFITDQTDIIVCSRYRIGNKISEKSVRGQWFDDKILMRGTETVKTFIYFADRDELRITLKTVIIETEEAENET